MKLIHRYIATLIILVLGFTATAQTNKPVEDFFPATPNPSSIPAAPTYNINPYMPAFNYVRTWTPRKPILDISNPYEPGVGMETTYKNGFGSAVQSIVHGSLGRADIIKLGNLIPGNTHYNYLPYADMDKSTKFRMNGYSDQESYHSTLFPDEWGYSFTRKDVFVNNQVIYSHSYNAGLSFTGDDNGSVTYQTFNNSWNAPDEIYVWEHNGAGGYPQINTIYNSDELVITHDTADQHGSYTKTYADKSGRVLCKKVKDGANWLTTYYVYDELGRVSWILPPKAIPASVLPLPYFLPASVADSLCYYYKYNKYNQLVEKRVPDRTGTEKTVYDRLHRQVLYQNPILAQENKWQFTVYDIKDRVVFTGILTEIAGNTREFWQARVLEDTGWTGPTTYQPIVEYLRHSTTSMPMSITNCQINTFNFYDDYSNAPVAGLVGAYKSYPTDYISQAETTIPVMSEHTDDLLVYSQTRVLDPNNSNIWIHTAYYYDFEGRLIQTRTRKPWNANNLWDINSTQYDFNGNVVLEIFEHNSWSGSNKAKTTQYTHYQYDYLTGLLGVVKQKLDSGGWMPIANYAYDNMRRVSEKLLGNVEEQRYTYSIRGELVGINGDWVFDTSNSARRTFGEKICYDYGFDEKRYDGKITGYIYRGSGTLSLPRAYGYLYDDVGRIIKGDFHEMRDPNSPPPFNPPPNWYGWHKDVDFTAYGIEYDKNGNMTRLRQMGNALSGPVEMDNLTYTYHGSSNRLKEVTDAVGSNYNLHDFLDGNIEGTDYQYDANGNLTQDLNKGITNITYNHMDLPTLIQTGTGSISKIYDAAGTLLQKITTENSVSDTERYWGPFVYRDDSLLYVLHDEGRSRYIAAQNEFQNDFFVKDHLGNVRTVVQSVASNGLPDNYQAGWEIALSNLEEGIFDPIGPIRDNKPQGGIGDWESGRLNGENSGERIGAALLLHGMSGDVVEFGGYGYYEDSGPFDTYTMPEYMLESLTDMMVGTSGEGGEGGPLTTTVNNLLTNTNYDAYDILKQNATDPNYPRTYLNTLVFDENFTLLPEQSSVTQFKGAQNTWVDFTTSSSTTLATNGYVLIYYSNEGHSNIWVDNVYVRHYKGALLEETHYYPHGLTVDMGIQGVEPENDYLHQGKKLERALGIDLYDFHVRQYDPQIGRFWGVDLMDQFPSGYTGMGNDPANMIDPTGMVARNRNVINETSSPGDRPAVEGGIGGLNRSIIMTYATNPFAAQQDISNMESLALSFGGGGGGAPDDAAPTDVYDDKGNKVTTVSDGKNFIAIIRAGSENFVYNNTVNLTVLQILGLADIYDMDAFDKFYEENFEKVATSIEGIPMENLSSWELNGVRNAELKAESGIEMGRINGVITTIGTARTDGDAQFVGRGGSIWTAHIHTFTEGDNLKFSIANGVTRQPPIYNGPSEGDIKGHFTNLPQYRNIPGNRSIMIDKYNYYFYNGSSTFITIPKRR